VNPFVAFQQWLRSGPRVERMVTAVASVLACALLAWAAVPGDDGEEVAVAGDSAVDATAGPAESAVATTVAPVAGATPVVGASGPAAGPGGATGPASGAAPVDQPAAGPSAPTDQNACDNTATDVGVSAEEVLVGVILYDLGALNSGLGLDPADAQRAFTDQIIQAVNERGGVQCRTLVPRYYSDNVLDSAGEHSICLQMVQDGVFATLNNLFTPAETTCPARQGIPNIWATPVHNTDVVGLAPFVLTPRTDFEQLIRNYVFGLQQYGFYDGLGRLGLLIDSCFGDINDAIFANLAALGFERDVISVYDYGCPGTITPPNLHFAAALQMKRDGVTHLMNTAYGAAGPFASAAADQGFRPRYGLMDDNGATLMQTANPPVDPTLDGALMITADQTGAEHTDGVVFSPATQACVDIAARSGVGSPLAGTTTAAPLRGLQCALVELFVAAANRTRPLVRTGLAGGMATLGQYDLAFPVGQSFYNNPDLPAGGQFWRAITYAADCTCFRLVDGAWYPSFG
jgi:hypothetical protein